jgi:hypothetical protein
LTCCLAAAWQGVENSCSQFKVVVAFDTPKRGRAGWIYQLLQRQTMEYYPVRDARTRAMANISKPGARACFTPAISSLVFAVIVATLPLTIAAQTHMWYLMAPDEKVVSNPRVAIRMEHGPVMGPLDFTARAKFSSRAECEPARQQLVTAWRQDSVIKRGSWDRYGFTSPSIFIRCVRADDPQLKKSNTGADAPQSMETFVNRPSHR